MREIKKYWQNLIAAFVMFRRYMSLCFTVCTQIEQKQLFAAMVSAVSIAVTLF